MTLVLGNLPGAFGVCTIMKKPLLLIPAGAAVALIATVALVEKNPAPAAEMETHADAGEKPLRIAHGAEVDIGQYLVAGKTVIFDFTSRYCPPCEAIAPYLHRLNAKLDDLVVVEVDINRPETRKIDWQSPVARQYELTSIPHFKIYDGNGELAAEGDAAYKQIVGLIEEHLVEDEG